jgi:large subunit ribosomal protein L35
MPKQKTHKASKKRFRLSATGKAMHRQAGTSHLASRMTQKRKRNLRGTKAAAPMESRRIRRLLGDYSA